MTKNNKWEDEKNKICHTCLREPKKEPTLAEKIIEACTENYMMRKCLEIEKIALEEAPRAYLTAVKKATVRGFLYCGGVIIGEFYAHPYALVSKEEKIDIEIQIQNHIIFSPKTHRSAMYYARNIDEAHKDMILATRAEVNSGKLFAENLHPLARRIFMPGDFGIDVKKIDKCLEELTKPK